MDSKDASAALSKPEANLEKTRWLWHMSAARSGQRQTSCAAYTDKWAAVRQPCCTEKHHTLARQLTNLRPGKPLKIGGGMRQVVEAPTNPSGRSQNPQAKPCSKVPLVPSAASWACSVGRQTTPSLQISGSEGFKKRT